MSQSDGPPVPYRVVYSERVRIELRRLLEDAVARGHGRPLLEAAKKIDAILRVYPQFGDPLWDLQTVSETVWHGTVPPLVVQYLIDESHRLVLVVTPMRLFQGTTHQAG